MKILVAGASGFLGRALVSHLRDHEVVALVRHGETVGHARSVAWNGLKMGSWAYEIDGADAVVNFAGAPLCEKWTGESMRVMKESRVQTTYLIGQAIDGAERPPKVWINASAVGIYGSRGAEGLDELSAPGTGFLADLCRVWEDAFMQERLPQTRRVALRSGMVLGRDGGALPPLMKRARMFFGGAQGDGHQWMPWIHVDDHAEMVKWTIENDVAGPVNACGPAPCLNSTFMEMLRGVVHRPMCLPSPKLFRGKDLDEENTLPSIRALPRVAREGGFRWRFPALEAALSDLVCQPAPAAAMREKVSVR